MATLLCTNLNLPRIEWKIFMMISLGSFPHPSLLFPPFIHCNWCLFPFLMWGLMAGLPGFILPVKSQPVKSVVRKKQTLTISGS